MKFFTTVFDDWLDKMFVGYLIAALIALMSFDVIGVVILSIAIIYFIGHSAVFLHGYFKNKAEKSR